MAVLRKCCNPWDVYETEVASSSFRDPGCGVSPEEKIGLEHMQLLRDAFISCTSPDKGSHGRSEIQTQHNGRNGWSGGKRDGREREQGMSFEEFREALSPAIGPDSEAGWVEKLFREVDLDCVGQVKWEQLRTYLLQQCSERDRSSVPRDAILDTEPRIRHCSHNKLESTTRVVAIPHPPPFRYISVSKGGLLTVWNRHLHILKTLGLAGDPAEDVADRRRFRGWTTDAVYMDNVHKVAIATSCRDLHFVDVSTHSVFEEVHLFGFRDAPTALCYRHDAKHSLLLWGDEKGGVHLMCFLKPRTGLFENPFSEGNSPQKIYMQDIDDHSRLVSYRHIPNVHQEPINRVIFEPHNDLIMTSSGSDASSVVIMDVSLRREPYIWKIDKGVTCFDYSRSLNLVVTGGLDPAVRLWNRFVTVRPVGTLLGHRTTVLDVAIYHPLRQIFSYSKDAELRVWDTSSHLCLRTLHLQFPCLRPGHNPGHGNFPFLLLSPPLPGKTAPHLLVGCKDYLAVLRLAEGRRVEGGCTKEGGGETQGGAPLSCALYNPTLRHVVTGFKDSSVSVWDVETGLKRLMVSNAHGDEEITCMALDCSHRRLITGARNGTIKVWNLLNGHNLHKLQPVTSSEVTGVTCLPDNQLLVVGWSQRIAQYDIAGAKDVYVKADMSWKSDRVHRSDTLAVCHCTALGVVATASRDGEVTVWSLETQGPLIRLQRDTESGVAPPVDSLLFLQRRARDRQWRIKAVLVSSQAGCICLWSISEHTHTHVQFYAPEERGERVLALSSDQQNNSVLVTGDTTGWLQVWDISHYALDITQKNSMPPVSERPPLLRSWRAHEGALVSVEVLGSTDRLLVLTASVDGSARLWTESGENVGSFGQEAQWDIGDPATYHGDPGGEQTDMTEEMDEEEEERNGSHQSEHSEVKGQTTDLVSQGQTSQEECHSEAPAPHNPTESVSPPEDDEQPQRTKSLCGDVGWNAASRRERRRVFGSIDVNKLSRVGRECTPYQALALQEACLPEDLPRGPCWTRHPSLRYTSEAELSSLQLSVNGSE